MYATLDYSVLQRAPEALAARGASSPLHALPWAGWLSPPPSPSPPRGGHPPVLGRLLYTVGGKSFPPKISTVQLLLKHLEGGKTGNFAGGGCLVMPDTSRKRAMDHTHTVRRPCHVSHWWLTHRGDATCAQAHG